MRIELSHQAVTQVNNILPSWPQDIMVTPTRKKTVNTRKLNTTFSSRLSKTIYHKFSISSKHLLLESKLHNVLFADVAEGGVEVWDSTATHPLFHKVGEVLA